MILKNYLVRWENGSVAVFLKVYITGTYLTVSGWYNRISEISSEMIWKTRGVCLLGTAVKMRQEAADDGFRRIHYFLYLYVGLVLSILKENQALGLDA